MALKPAHFLPELLQAIIDENQVALTYSQHELQTINVRFFDLFYREGVWFTHAINIDNKKPTLNRKKNITISQIRKKT